MGYTTKSGVVLTGAQARYADLLASRLSFPLVVTSGSRSPVQQARAMLAKLAAKGPNELYTVYRSNRALVDQLLALPRDAEAWARLIESRGAGLSRHLWGGAIDVRTNDLTAAQVAAIKAAATATGGRPYLEYDHLHVDLPSGAVAQGVVTAGVSGARRALPWALGVGLLVGVVVAAVAHRRTTTTASSSS